MREAALGGRFPLGIDERSPTLAAGWEMGGGPGSSARSCTGRRLTAPVSHGLQLLWGAGCGRHFFARFWVMRAAACLRVQAVGGLPPADRSLGMGGVAFLVVPFILLLGAVAAARDLPPALSWLVRRRGSQPGSTWVPLVVLWAPGLAGAGVIRVQFVLFSWLVVCPHKGRYYDRPCCSAGFSSGRVFVMLPGVGFPSRGRPRRRGLGLLLPAWQAGSAPASLSRWGFALVLA